MIHSNTATDGGGVYINQGVSNLYNNTVASNSSDGLFVYNTAGTTTATNNIIALNARGIKLNTGTPTPTVTLSHNDVYGNTSANYVNITDPTGSSGNISADPLFIGSGNYAILFASACREGGDNSVVQTGDEDLDGTDRIVGTNVDIGAYEFFDETAPTPGTVTSPEAVQVTTGGTIEVTYAGASDNVNGSGLAKVELWVKKESTSTWMNSGIYGTSSSGTLVYTPSGGSAMCYFDTVVEDGAGNRSAAAEGDGDCHTQYYEAGNMYVVWQPNGSATQVQVTSSTVPVGGVLLLRAVMPIPAGKQHGLPNGTCTVTEEATHSVTPIVFTSSSVGTPNTAWGDPVDSIVAVYTLLPSDTNYFLHNSNYSVSANLYAGVEDVGPNWPTRYWRCGMSVMARNLNIDSCDKDLLVWKGEEGTTIPLTVTLSDSDLLDPYKLTLKVYSTKADNRSTWPIVRTMEKTACTGSTQTFEWDGKDGSGEYVEPWSYTFEVEAVDDTFDPIKDSANYRSSYLQIIRATDPTTGDPIYDAEYAGYDDNGTTETEEDDNYLYYIRPYVLKDTLATTGTITESEGEIWLYDPDLEKVHTWNIANLPCRNHDDAHDGLNATAEGLQHDVLMKVPIGDMNSAGMYRFVVHVRDDHTSRHRDHQLRWAEELNCAKDTIGIALWYNDTTANSCSSLAEEAHRILRGHDHVYNENAPAGDPSSGGSGLMSSAEVDVTKLIRTLLGFWPWDNSTERKYVSKNAIWAYFGHATPMQLLLWEDHWNSDYITVGNSLDQNSRTIGLSAVDPQKSPSLCIPSLNHILLVFLDGCNTASGNPSATEVDPDSITQAFRNKGAKCAVGFAGKQHNMICHDEFNTLFWNGCMSGATVFEAAMKAAAKAKMRRIDEMKGYTKPRPLVTGNVTIVPPRYGK